MDTPEGVQYMDVPPNDSRYGTVLQIIRNSFLDPHYQPSWVIHSLKTVKNMKLFQHYKNKSDELKHIGRDATEYDMFTCYKTVDLIKNILEHGLQTRQSSFNFLGNSQKGVNLCKHADIQLKAAENTGQEECYLIVYKVMLGKALPVYPSPDNQHLAPTENFDSHISSLSVDRTIPLGQQAIRSQVFCYEYINGQLSSCPRHVLPYVVVCYKRPSHTGIGLPSVNVPLQRSTIQPPPPPLVQMAPAPQASGVSGLYQRQASNDVGKVPDFQPRLPPRNPFRARNFPIPPGPQQSYQVDAREYTTGPSVQMPVVNLSSNSMIVPVVPHSIHQPSTGMCLPYISHPPPLLNPGNRLVFSQNSHNHFTARASLTSLPQPRAEQNFGMFSNSARVPTFHTGMSIPLQLPTTEIPGGRIHSGTRPREPAEVTGMRLPIVIQPEEPSPNERPVPSEQIESLHQEEHMHLPTMVAPESLTDCQPASSVSNTSRSESPTDVKPDISKIHLNMPTKRSRSSEVICVDQEEIVNKVTMNNTPVTSGISTLVMVPSKGIANTTMASANSIGSLVQTLISVSSQQDSLPVVQLDTCGGGTAKRVSSSACVVQEKRNGVPVVGVNGQIKVDNEPSVIPKEVNFSNADSNAMGENKLKTDINVQDTSDNTFTKKLHLVKSAFPGMDKLGEDDTLPDLPSVVSEQCTATVHLPCVESESGQMDLLATGENDLKTTSTVQKVGECTIVKKLHLTKPAVHGVDEFGEDDTLPDLSLVETEHCVASPNMPCLEREHDKMDLPNGDEFTNVTDTVSELKNEGHVNSPNMTADKTTSSKARNLTRKVKRNLNTYFMKKLRSRYCRRRNSSHQKNHSRCNEYAVLTYPVLQETPVFQFHWNGSIQMFCDIYDNPEEKEDQEKYLKTIGSLKTLILLHKEFAKFDVNSMLKDLGADGADVDVEVMGQVNDGENCVHMENDEHRLVNPLVECHLDSNRGTSSVFLEKEVDPDVESILCDDGTVNDSQIMANEREDEWQRLVKREKYQPKVIVKDIRCNLRKDELAATEKQDDGASEDDDCLTLQIALVESLQESANEAGAASDQADSSHLQRISDLTDSCQESDKSAVRGNNRVTQEQQTDVVRQRNQGDQVDLKNDQQLSVRANSSSEGDLSSLKETDNDKANVDSVRSVGSAAKNENSSTEMHSEDAVRSNSPVVDLSQVESWGTQLSLLNDLNNDGATEKSSIVLNELSKVRRELSKSNNDIADVLERSTLDLFIDEDETSIETKKQRVSDQAEDKHELHRMGSNEGGIHHQCNSKDDQVLFHKKRSSRSKDVDVCKSYKSHFRKHRHSRYKREHSAHSQVKDVKQKHEGDCHAKLKRYTSPEKCALYHKDRHKTHSGSETLSRKKRAANPDSNYKRFQRMKSTQPDEQHENHRTSRQDSNSGRSEGEPEQEARPSESNNNNMKTKEKSEPKAQETVTDLEGINQEEMVTKCASERCDVNKTADRNSEADLKPEALKNDKCLETSPNIQSEAASSAELTQSNSEAGHPSHRKEVTEGNQKWVETCERLFLGKSGKEGSPLCDGYSGSSGFSSIADPSEWLTRLIRINTKRKSSDSCTMKADKLEKGGSVIKTVNGEGDVRKVDAVQSDKEVPSTIFDTPVVSRGQGAPVKSNEKPEVNLSREQLTDLISRALTILQPNDVLTTAADNCQPGLSVQRNVSEQSDPTSYQDRISCKYPHRKRQSVPYIASQSSCENPKQPKLWGSTSLEEMHRSAAFQEPVLRSLPKHQSSGDSAIVSGPSAEVDVRKSPNTQEAAYYSMIGSGTIISDSALQARDPRRRRLSLSPRRESGSDVETVFHSSQSTESAVKDCSAGSAVDVDNAVNPKNRISKLWKASISTPKALGNESVAFRELKGKDRGIEPCHRSRRVSSSERTERKLSVDEKFTKYTPWKRDLKAIDIPERVYNTIMEQRIDVKDPRLKKKGCLGGEFGKHPTKHCRNIPLEPVKKETPKPAVKDPGKASHVEDAKQDNSSKTDCHVSDGITRTGVAQRRNGDGDCSTPRGDALRNATSCTTLDRTDMKRSSSLGSKVGHVGHPFLKQPRLGVEDIGTCCPAVRSAMEKVWRLDTDEYQSLTNEMAFLLNNRIKAIGDSLIFNDPTKGLDQQRRLKLISSGTLSEGVTRELKIEEDMRIIKEENHRLRQQLDDGEKNRSLSERDTKELKFQMNIRDIKYEKYNKELENIGRFYKSSVVEVLPDMFRLEEEKRKFISVEGNMLFLVSPLKQTDCRRLLGLLEEIKEYQNVMESTSATYEDQEHARKRLGWLHGERKETLCQLCLNMYHSKQILLQRFLDRFSWCNKVEHVLQMGHENKDLLNYVKDRRRTLDLYLNVLGSVQRLDNGVWAVKNAKSFDGCKTTVDAQRYDQNQATSQKSCVGESCNTDFRTAFFKPQNKTVENDADGVVTNGNKLTETKGYRRSAIVSITTPSTAKENENKPCTPRSQCEETKLASCHLDASMVSSDNTGDCVQSHEETGSGTQPVTSGNEKRLIYINASENLTSSGDRSKHEAGSVQAFTSSSSSSDCSKPRSFNGYSRKENCNSDHKSSKPDQFMDGASRELDESVEKTTDASFSEGSEHSSVNNPDADWRPVFSEQDNERNVAPLEPSHCRQSNNCTSHEDLEGGGRNSRALSRTQSRGEENDTALTINSCVERTNEASEPTPLPKAAVSHKRKRRRKWKANRQNSTSVNTITAQSLVSASTLLTKAKQFRKTPSLIEQLPVLPRFGEQCKSITNDRYVFIANHAHSNEQTDINQSCAGVGYNPERRALGTSRNVLGGFRRGGRKKRKRFRSAYMKKFQ